MPVERVILGLGANVGRPLEQLAEAVAALRAFVHVHAVSSVYRTEPVGFGDQPDFLNVVVAGGTALEPEALLDATQGVEAAMGRVRTFANAPRPIDVDLLAYGDREVATSRLTLPHPGIAKRGFVLYPLAEVAPAWVHPVLRQTARELLRLAGPLERVERLGALPSFA
jgi:2-amino-4-hydroxy-6-hydroxymethyldihydropteridine diphosphokinase